MNVETLKKIYAKPQLRKQERKAALQIHSRLSTTNWKLAPSHKSATEVPQLKHPIDPVKVKLRSAR